MKVLSVFSFHRFSLCKKDNFSQNAKDSMVWLRSPLVIHILHCKVYYYRSKDEQQPNGCLAISTRFSIDCHWFTASTNCLLTISSAIEYKLRTPYNPALLKVGTIWTAVFNIFLTLFSCFEHLLEKIRPS